MERETLEAKLRNQLTPLCGLADLILLMDKKPELKPIIIEMAKQAVSNNKKIKPLLEAIESKTINWIAVKNHLPNHTNNVLGCNIHTGLTYTCRRYKMDRKNFVTTQNDSDGEGNYEATESITHWTEFNLPNN